MSAEELSDTEKLDLIVDTVELFSCRRRVRQIRARLRGEPDAAGDESQRLFQEATRLQRRVNELVRKLSSVSAE
jgi:DNA primase